MRISRRELGCIVPAALAGWSLTAAAQSSNAVEGIANYSGTDRQAVLEILRDTKPEFSKN